MSDTNRQAVVVTGASRGIGRAIALRLARDGFDLMLNYASRSAEAAAVVDELRALGAKAEAIQGDVADQAAMERLFAAATERFGRLFAVVHSAGIMPLSPIADGDVATFDKVIAVNLRGAFIVLGLAAKTVIPGGRIVALSSSVIAKSFPGYGPYIAAKAGVEGLVHVLANEMRGKSVTVNAVAPGPVATELFLTGKTPEQIEQLGKLAPLERLGRPEDIAAVTSFLLGPDGGWVNAQVLRANGGFA